MPPPPPVYISFQTGVNDMTASILLNVIGQQIQAGKNNIHLLISTPGGSTTTGIGLYHTLKGLPLDLTTHNVGGVNSIGNIIYLAGETRYACQSTSFMFHGVGMDIQQASRFEEKKLIESLDQIQNDQELLAEIISDRTNIDKEAVAQLFLQAAYMGSEEAKEHGIVHDIRDVDIPQGAEFLQLVFQR